MPTDSEFLVGFDQKCFFAMVRNEGNCTFSNVLISDGAAESRKRKQKTTWEQKSNEPDKP